MNSKKIIVALDGFDTDNEILDFVMELDNVILRYKVGLEAFIRFGKHLVYELVGKGKKVFLDLKIEDIPKTVELAISALANMVEFVTLRGDYDVITAARLGLNLQAAQYPRLLWVPILSSQQGEFILNPKMRDAPLDGIITSGKRIIQFKNLFPDKIIIAPGIRMDDDSLDDHAHTSTPEQAINWGADYLIIGRPITSAIDPRKAVQEIIKRII